MKSSLLHFLITFVIAFAVFGLLAYTYYGSLVAKIPTGVPSEAEVSAAEPESEGDSDPSGLVISIPDDSREEPADNFKTVSGLLIFKDSDGFVSEARYIRINERRKMVVSCNFPVTVSLYNDVGALIPISDYFAMIPGEQACRDIIALTGAEADFYIEMDVDSLRQLLGRVGNCTFTMDRVIDYINPAYENYTPLFEGDYPEDYRRHIDAGQVELTQDVLNILLEYHSLQTTAGKPNDIRPLLNQMYESVFRAVLVDQKMTYVNNARGVMSLLEAGRTNLTESFLLENGNVLFAYGDYYHNEIVYTAHDATLHKIKEADAA